MEVVLSAGMSVSLCLAYIGPGAGLSALGALAALAFAVVVALFGFVWYPIRRLSKRLRGTDGSDQPGSP